MTDTPALLFRVDILVPAPLPDTLELLLAERAPWGWHEEETRDGVLLRIHFPTRAAAGEMAARIQNLLPQAEPLIEQEQQADWSLTWREFFEPVRAGRFLVVPPWTDPAEIAPGATPIVIEPKMAFGTGHHPTTFLCLQAIDELFPPGGPAGRTFLDLGTGSGILGIACAKAGLTGIGVDIDPLAVENAQENIAANRVAPAFKAMAGTLDSIRSGIAFDLVVANILAQPLADMAPVLTTRLRPPGRLILSGLLREQEFFVTTAYRQQGLAQPRILRKGEWSALIWEPSTI